MTPKREKFLRIYLRRPCWAQAKRAFKEAGYSTEGADWTRNLVRLLGHPEIKAIIEVTRQKARERLTDKMALTLESHLEELEKLREQAAENRQYSAAVSAEVQRGKAAGLYVDKKQLDGDIVIRWGGDEDRPE